MISFARETGGQPHEQGSFFLGQPVADPGPLFYLVAAPLRLSPVALLGLATLALVAWRWRSVIAPSQWRLVLALLAYAGGFWLFMTLGAKKFDRYLLPVFPVLDVLAAIGLVGAWKVLSRSAGRRLARLPAVALAFALGLAAWPVLAVYPHYLAYYNPLLGGGAVAIRAIPVGEGEGLAEVSRWLNAQPGASDLRVVSDSYDALQATFIGSGEALRDRVPPSADYVVLYAYQTQIVHSPRVQADYAARTPEYVVRLNGIEYARVYRSARERSAGERESFWERESAAGERVSGTERSSAPRGERESGGWT
jgi:hypothetical protein